VRVIFSMAVSWTIVTAGNRRGTTLEGVRNLSEDAWEERLVSGLLFYRHGAGLHDF
jgi:hypothetical protein